MSQNIQIKPGEYEDVMPEMGTEEFESLKASIKQDGLRHPIEVTEDGTIVDGHHRFKACQELRVDPEFEVVDDHDVERAIRANFTRRDHSDGTKRHVVEWYLKEHWGGETTQRELAEASASRPRSSARRRRPSWRRSNLQSVNF